MTIPSTSPGRGKTALALLLMLLGSALGGFVSIVAAFEWMPCLSFDPRWEDGCGDWNSVLLAAVSVIPTPLLFVGSAYFYFRRGKAAVPAQAAPSNTSRLSPSLLRQLRVTFAVMLVMSALPLLAMALEYQLPPFWEATSWVTELLGLLAHAVMVYRVAAHMYPKPMPTSWRLPRRWWDGSAPCPCSSICTSRWPAQPKSGLACLAELHIAATDDAASTGVRRGFRCIMTTLIRFP